MKLFYCVYTLAVALTVSCKRKCSNFVPKPNKDLWLHGKVPLKGEPAYEYRILDHWDNLDDTVERGYAGNSIFGWTLDEVPKERIVKYARLNQKIGINGAVLNNVNANPQILTEKYLNRVKEIADIIRPYGMRTFLSVNFASPSALEELETADPLVPEVREWWNKKAEQIYDLIPDFGGFLVKASSEGQPGPGDFGRSHAEGANMLAEAVEPYGGIVMWRAFVYSATSPDRAMQAAEEFLPLEGEFKDNVVIQIKNGPIDFQPREPFSPLFGLLKKTSMAPELQVTQEYLGQSKNFVYLGPMWEEFFNSDTYRDGEGSTVAEVTSSSELSVIAGVANVGDGDLMCGSIAAQINWYAYGRLAWDPTLSAKQIAREWIDLSFERPRSMSKRQFEKNFVKPMLDMLLSSRETCVDFMMPLGLHHLFHADHHYGPDPSYETTPMPRPDWAAPYYHKADAYGVGFDRSSTGSNAVSQYNEPLRSLYDGEDCPEELILWFHHVAWDHKMKSGNTLWEELNSHYENGVKQSEDYLKQWKKMKSYVDKERYDDIKKCMETQVHDAHWWKDTVLDYFQGFVNGTRTTSEPNVASED